MLFSTLTAVDRRSLFVYLHQQQKEVRMNFQIAACNKLKTNGIFTYMWVHNDDDEDQRSSSIDSKDMDRKKSKSKPKVFYALEKGIGIDPKQDIQKFVYIDQHAGVKDEAPPFSVFFEICTLKDMMDSNVLQIQTGFAVIIKMRILSIPMNVINLA